MKNYYKLLEREHLKIVIGKKAYMNYRQIEEIVSSSFNCDPMSFLLRDNFN